MANDPAFTDSRPPCAEDGTLAMAPQVYPRMRPATHPQRVPLEAPPPRQPHCMPPPQTRFDQPAITAEYITARLRRCITEAVQHGNDAEARRLAKIFRALKLRRVSPAQAARIAFIAPER